METSGQNVVSIDYTPNPKQAAFHAAGEWAVLFGGSAGPGKSHALRMDALAYALKYPGSHVRLARRTVGDLRASLFEPMLHMLPATDQFKFEIKHSDPPSIIIKLHPTDRRFWSRITFLYYDNDADYMRWQGDEFDYLGVDEITQFKESWVKYMLTRLRTSKKDENDRFYPTYFRCSANPGGTGHGFIKKMFVSPAPPNTPFQDRFGKTFRFVPKHKLT